MKLFAKLFGRSRRSGDAPAADAGRSGNPPAAPPTMPPGTPYGASAGSPPAPAPHLGESDATAGHVAVDQEHTARISFGQLSTEGRGATGTGQEADVVVCGACGHHNPPGGRFCSNCGARLGAGAERASEQTSTISISGIEALDAEPAPREILTPEAQAAVDALPPGTALLVVRRGPNSGSRFLLDSDRTTAGRHPQSDIFLDDVTVSRKHAEFRRTPGGFAVADVGSLNGTYVGRERIDEVPLAPGDEVQIGKYRLVFFPSRQGQIG